MISKPTAIPPANRIASIKPYFFHQLNQKIAGLKKDGLDIIRLDMGSPDLPPNDFIVDALVESTRQPDTHGYAPYGGTNEFRQAAAAYYQERFNVALDPQSETLGLIGSKEGIFNLTQAVVDPGDAILVPSPGYPTYATSSNIAGASVHLLPLRQENRYLPDLNAIPEETAHKAKIIWINYPNNPTGAIAELEDFEQILAFADKYGIIVAHDAPYLDVNYDDYQPVSILEVPGAKNIAVEFYSLSKTFNMAGWRLGFAAGNKDCIQHLNTYKTLVDSSSFKPLFAAGEAALQGSQEWVKDRNRIYQRRRDLTISGFKKLGFELDTPKATLYLWIQLPEDEPYSIPFCERLLNETGVSTTPGNIYGDHGEGYFRISLCTPEDRIQEGMQRLVKWRKSSSE